MPPSLQRSNSGVSQDPEYTLRKQFNKTSFRPFQREIIDAALQGKDVFVQAATSFGKSLCFQLPAVLDAGSKYCMNPIHTYLPRYKQTH